MDITHRFPKQRYVAACVTWCFNLVRERLMAGSRSGICAFLSVVVWAGGMLLIPTTKATPQSISGDVVEQASGLPVVGAFVLLINEDSTVLERSLTDTYGRFTIQAPSPGRYALKSAIIGFRSTVTPYFDLVANQDIEIQFVIPGVPISLPTLVVEDNRTCGGPPEAGLAAATVWDEAKKALEAAYWTEQQGTLQHVTVQYERILDPQSLEIRESHQQVVSDIYSGSPFRTADPADLLAELGFIREMADNQWRHIAPDPSILLSDAFADHHCFSTIRGEGDRAGYIGLEFEPDPGRNVPDIEGVLWLDATTAELRFMNFGYTNTPYRIGAEEVGGRLEFERLPQGPWVVRRWWIRMPIHGTRRGAYSDFVPEVYLSRIKEDGGYIQEIRTLDGEVVGGRGVATISGVVLNLRSGEPLVSVDIVLVGTDFVAPTDNEGRFRFDGLPEGTYWLSYGPRTLNALGFVPPVVEVSATIDESPFVTMAIPSISRLWVSLCPNSEFRNDVGILSGFIRDSRGIEPLPGAQVVATRIDTDGEEDSVLGEGETNWAGYYRICDIPEDVGFLVEARMESNSGMVTDTAQASLDAFDIIRVDFNLRIPGIRRPNFN